MRVSPINSKETCLGQLMMLKLNFPDLEYMWNLIEHNSCCFSFGYVISIVVVFHLVMLFQSLLFFIWSCYFCSCSINILSCVESINDITLSIEFHHVMWNLFWLVVFYILSCWFSTGSLYYGVCPSFFQFSWWSFSRW